MAATSANNVSHVRPMTNKVVCSSIECRPPYPRKAVVAEMQPVTTAKITCRWFRVLVVWQMCTSKHSKNQNSKAQSTLRLPLSTQRTRNFHLVACKVLKHFSWNEKSPSAACAVAAK
eukprot:6182018-Pleurochrysis_carterae.AAC.3